MQHVSFGNMFLLLKIRAKSSISLILKVIKMGIQKSSLGSKLLCLTIATLCSTANVNAERLWSRSSPNWTPKTVSMGLRGTQVFGPIDVGQDHVALYSGFSPDPAPPVWQNNLPIEGMNMESASADTTDVHVVLSQLTVNNVNSNRQTVVKKYTSASSTPNWSYTFPGISAGLAKIDISNDGSRIVAALVYPSEMRLTVAVFSPNSGTPVSTFNINLFGIHLNGFIVSADGSTLYITSNSMVFIYNLANNLLIQQNVLPGMYSSHALCGNGRAFAYGEFNRVHLYERNNNGGYSQTWVGEYPGFIVTDRLVLSDDCSTLGIGLHEYSQDLTVKIKMIDVQSKNQLMQDECTGIGTFQNVVSDMSLSADGSRLAVALWGDGGNVCSELRVYNRDTDTPIYQHNYPGSVHALDMSPDGKRVVTAVKPVHANTFAGGGSFDLHAIELDELRIVGIPRPGATVSVRLRGLPANSPTQLLTSTSLLQEPVYMGNMGSLFLPRLSMNPIAFTDTNSIGQATGNFQIPAGSVGSNLFMQAIAMLPRRLTENFEQIKTLP